MDRPAVNPRAFWAPALALIGLALGWVIVADAASNDLAASRPAWAFRLNPHQPEALLTLADRALARGATDEASAYARRALASGPLDAGAYRVLAAAEEKAGRGGAASRLYDFGWSLSRRDPAIAYELYRDAITQRRYAAALDYADALLRRSPNARGVVIPQLVAATADPQAAALIANRLAQGPDWRGAFMQDLGRRAPSNAVAADILRRLQDSPAPPTAAEVAPFLNTLVIEGDYAEARRQWIAFLPPTRRPRVGGVFDGEFRYPPGPPPFGWDVDLANGNEARLDPQDDDPALTVYSAGQKGGAVARQLIVLSPGRYNIVSRGHMLEGSESPLEWRLVCLPDNRILVRAPFTVSGPKPNAFSAEVTVPADCPAQRLILSALPREHRSRAVAVIEHVGVEAGDAP